MNKSGDIALVILLPILAIEFIKWENWKVLLVEGMFYFLCFLLVAGWVHAIYKLMK